MNLSDVKNGTRARLLREQSGLSREQLAAKASCSTSTVARLELQDKLPKTDTLIRIASVLGVSIGALAGEEPGDDAALAGEVAR